MDMCIFMLSAVEEISNVFSYVDALTSICILYVELSGNGKKSPIDYEALHISNK